MLLTDELRIAPFARILPPFAAGIVCCPYAAAPLWGVALIAAGIYAAAWPLRKTRAGQAYLSAALFCTGILVAKLSETRHPMPLGEKLVIIAEVDRAPSVRGQWNVTTVRTGAFRPYRKEQGGWRATDEKIELLADTSYSLPAGSQLAFAAYLNPVDTTGSRYGALMRSRGIAARACLSRGNLLDSLGGNGRRAARSAALFQQRAAERLAELDLPDADRNMVCALVAGERRGMDRALRADYARTGVSHILAVSGLHMGFVLLIANLLLGWTALLPRGHLVKNALVIVLLWTYAAMTGLSPSVVRSALMLSAAQAALGASVRGNGYNIVLGTATLMLAARPSYLFDASFQLSFAAVLSILFFYPRLYRRRLSPYRAPDALYSSLLLGAAAQIGTLPLVAYHFGNIPLVALLINPVVIVSAFVVIGAGLAWLLLPLAVLNPVCSGIIAAALRIQNGTVAWAASLPVAGIGGVHPSGRTVAAVYLLLGALAVAVKLREESRADDPMRPARKRKVAR